MKKPILPAKKKPAVVGRISCYQTHYSPAALSMMEKAIGQRITQLPPPSPPVPEVVAE